MSRFARSMKNPLYAKLYSIPVPPPTAFRIFCWVFYVGAHRVFGHYLRGRWPRNRFGSIISRILMPISKMAPAEYRQSCSIPAGVRHACCGPNTRLWAHRLSRWWAKWRIRYRFSGCGRAQWLSRFFTCGSSRWETYAISVYNNDALGALLKGPHGSLPRIDSRQPSGGRLRCFRFVSGSVAQLRSLIALMRPLGGAYDFLSARDGAPPHGSADGITTTLFRRWAPVTSDWRK